MARAWNPPAQPRDLLHDFDAAAKPIFDTPIAMMVKATLRLMQLPRQPKTDQVIGLAKKSIDQLEAANPLSSLRQVRSRTASVAA